MHIDKFWILHFRKFTHQSLKDVLEKDSKVKIVKQLFFSFFHAGCHVRLVFYPSQPHMGPSWLLKWSILFFSEKLKSLKRIFKNPWVKNQKIKFLLHTIQRLIQKDDFACMTYFPGRSKKCLMNIDKFRIFYFWKSPTDHWKKGLTKIQKLKLWSKYFFAFSMPVVMVGLCFTLANLIWVQFGF